MLAFKTALYILTIAIAFLFGGWEMRLKRQLTDEMPARGTIDYGMRDALRERMRRERFLHDLPPERLRKLRMIGGLKFLFVAILILEVLFSSEVIPQSSRTPPIEPS